MKTTTGLTAEELHAELSAVFLGLKNGTVKPVVAVEMNNAAGKIINLAKLRLDYARQLRETPSIPLLAGSIKSSEV